MQMNKLGYWVLASVLLAAPLGVMAGNPATDLIERMRHAVHTLNYTGTLVYSQGNELSTYQIAHAVNNGAETESVLRLSQGSNAPSGQVESFSLSRFSRMQPETEQAYSFDLGGMEQVANRSCQVVVARPRDRMRYLQRYCIDPESGMLLRYSLIDRSHNAVEHLMFTTLQINSLESAADSTFRAAPAASAAAQPATGVENNAWVFESLPPGFRQVQNLYQAGGNGVAPVQQIILSDGMTSVSVFIAPPGDTTFLSSMEVSSGAMNIYAAEVDQHVVTLVGEVPVEALKRISESLRYVR